MVENIKIEEILGSDDSFKQVLVDIKNKHHEKELYRLASERNISIHLLRKWYYGGSIPGVGHLEKLLDMDFSAEEKIRIANSVINSIFKRQKENNPISISLGASSTEKYLNVRNLPEEIKGPWKKKLSLEGNMQELLPEDFEERLKKIPLLLAHYSRSENPSYSGFIKLLYKEMDLSSIRKFSIAFGLNQTGNEVRKCLNMKEDDKHKDFKPSSDTVETLAEKAKLNEFYTHILWKVCRGDKTLGTEDAVIKKYSDLIKNENCYNKRKEHAKDLFSDLLKITGYTYIYISKLLGKLKQQKEDGQPGESMNIPVISAERLERYGRKESFFGGIDAEDPNRAYIIAPLLLPNHTEKQQKDIAANFLGLDEFKNKDIILTQFHNSITNGNKLSLNQAFLYTRLCVAVKNRRFFSDHMNISKTETIALFETSEAKRIKDPKPEKLAKDFLISDKSLITLDDFMYAVYKYRVNNGDIKNGIYTTLPFDPKKLSEPNLNDLMRLKKRMSFLIPTTRTRKTEIKPALPQLETTPNLTL